VEAVEEQVPEAAEEAAEVLDIEVAAAAAEVPACDGGVVFHT